MTIATATITPFEVTISNDDVADLRSRLARTRWTDWLPGTGWTYGVDEDYLKRLCAYWQDGFDFSAHVGWGGDHVLLRRPVAQIDDAAPLAAERHLGIVNLHFFFADRALHVQTEKKGLHTLVN